jgi:hypothetical protein
LPPTGPAASHVSPAPHAAFSPHRHMPRFDRIWEPLFVLVAVAVFWFGSL